jgi:hypothetical protein
MMTFAISRNSPRLVRPGHWPVLQAGHGIVSTTLRDRVAAWTAADCAGSAAAGSRLTPAGAIVITGFLYLLLPFAWGNQLEGLIPVIR